MTTFTGTVADLAIALHAPTATELDTWHDALAALTEPQTAYSPTWDSSGTAPVLNNGTIVAKYIQIGKFVMYSGRITMGSTTTFGSGIWQISVPVTPIDTTGIGTALCKDSSPAAGSPSSCDFRSASRLQFWPLSGAGQVNPTNPITWASGDSLGWFITYEAA